MGWLKALPDEAVRRSPVLSVFSAYAHMASGQLDGVEPRLADAERELARIPTGSERPWADTDELRTLPATIAVYRASLAQARGDIPATKEQARRALEQAGPTDHLARGSAAGFLGLAAWADGDVTTALETFTQAVGSLHAAGALVDELAARWSSLTCGSRPDGRTPPGSSTNARSVRPRPTATRSPERPPTCTSG